MQHGSLAIRNRLEGPNVWEFRWSEKGAQGKRRYRKHVIGTVDRYPSPESARIAVSGLIGEINWSNMHADSITMTVAQLANSFRTTRTCPQQYLAQLFHKESLFGLPPPLDRAQLGRLSTSAC
jgi:hypothetical protein